MEFLEHFELGQGISLKAKVEAFRRALVVAALHQGGSLTQAAALLSVNRSTLKEMMNSYGIVEWEWKPGPR